MSLIDRMPASVSSVEEAKATYTALAQMVKEENNPTVTLPADDKRDLGLLETLAGCAPVVTNTDGTRTVTLLVETPAPAAKPDTAVKQAAAAESSFARSEEQRRRE